MVDNNFYDECCCGCDNVRCCEFNEDWKENYKSLLLDNVIQVAEAKYSGAFLTCDGDAVYIKNVIYSNPAVVVLWSDGTKTVAKCNTTDTFSPESGLLVAIMKRIKTNNGLRELFNDWMPKVDTIKGIPVNVSISDVRKSHKSDK